MKKIISVIMLHKKAICWIFSVSVLLANSLNVAWGLGSGALSNETGVNAKTTSHGFAFAGIADDPSAIFYNPAGLVQVKGLSVMVGGAFIDMNSEHTNLLGQKDSMVSNVPFSPSFYIAYSAYGSPWAFGFGINSPFGLITEWKDDSFSRFYATKSKLLMYNAGPTVAYALSNEFSVGAGLNFFNVFDTELNQMVVNVDTTTFSTPTGTFGRSKLSGNGSAWGYNIGLHWKPSQKHNFGLTYKSQVNVVVKGDVNLSGLEDGTAMLFGGSIYRSDVATEFKFPQSVLLGYGYRPTDRWTVYADYEWVNWSVVEHTRFNYAQDNVALTHEVKRDWKSTNNIGVGTEYSVNKHVALRFGALVYERVIPSGTLESSLPDSSRFALSTGVGFKVGSSEVNLGYMRSFLSDQNIDNNAGNSAASMDGVYETGIDIFAVGIVQKWGVSK